MVQILQCYTQQKHLIATPNAVAFEFLFGFCFIVLFFCPCYMLKGENLNTKLGVVLLRQLDLRGVTVICDTEQKKRTIKYKP